MDVRSYFKKIRDLSAKMSDGDQVVVSLTTPDGGVAGVTTEVPKEIACRLVVEGKARLATAAEKRAHAKQQMELRKAWDEATAERRLHMQIVQELEPASKKKP